MDSLVPPSAEEMSRITQIQVQRQQEEKRKSREREKEERRRSPDPLPPPCGGPDLQHDTSGKGRSRHGNLLSSLRRKKSSSSSTRNDTHFRNEGSSSVAAAAVKSAQLASSADGSQDDDGDDSDNNNHNNILKHRAATLIQRTYRGYKTRREMKGLGLDADTRWTHALKELRFRQAMQPRPVRVKDDEKREGDASGPAATGKGTGWGSNNDVDEDDTARERRRRSLAARDKWRKVAVIASRAAADMDDDPTSSSDSDSDESPDSAGASKSPRERRLARQSREEAKARRRKDGRMMGLQYFLEMMDLKHRYGSNLRTYHEEWKKADTKEPFFYWLDYGEGKDLEITACPRERLEREQVRYLSREERQYYLVKVDAEGRLCWAKNGARIDTTEKWKDSIHGIVPADDPTPAFRAKSTDPNQPKLFPEESDPSSPSSSAPSASSSAPSGASETEREADRAAKYASPGFTGAKGYKKVTHLSASTVFNTLMRKSVRKNTWIFVADTSSRLYVGIKDSGAFQHSSFVQGSRVSAAGLVKIRDGRLASLSPLSGHYRPPAGNFRAFVRGLREAGVDMRRVSVSKSYAVLVGLEAYLKARRRGKDLLRRAGHGRDKVLRPEAVREREEAERDKSESAERERAFLERQTREEEGRRSAARVLQKLGMTPAVPGGQEVQEGREGAAAEGGVSSEKRCAAEEAAGDLLQTEAADENGRGSDGKTTNL